VTADRRDGPLRALLVALTTVTGLVDAFSYLTLGHVFVANMTGNVVFLGFGLAGVGGTSIVASLVAVIAFVIGAAAGGRCLAVRPLHRGRLLAVVTAAQSALVAVAAAVALTSDVGGEVTKPLLIALLAVAMGGQNAMARRLAVPDLTTTVLTLTVTGLVADTTSFNVRLRRFVPVAAMLMGALVGGALLRWVSASAPLWLATVMLVSCAVVADIAVRRPGSDGWR
jgi:uncharacterized membrane protein YoaK (UPF0700 family)